MAFKRLLKELEREHFEEVGSLHSQLQALRGEVDLLRDGLSPVSPILSCSAHTAPASSAVAPSHPSAEPAVGARLSSAHICNFSADEFLTLQQDDFAILESRVVSMLKRSGSKPIQSIADEFLVFKGWLTKKTSSRICIVDSPVFVAACSIGVFFNAVLFGIATDYSAREGPSKAQGFVIGSNRFFAAFFTVEILLRMFAVGPCTFFVLTKAWAWNLFDVVVVCIDLLWTVVSFIPKESEDIVHNMSILRILRVLRLARALRIVRLFNFFKELRLMVLSVLKSARTLFWSLMLMLITIYVFGVYLLDNVTFYLHTVNIGELGEKDRVNAELLQLRFGSMLQTFYTLFAILTGGLNWAEIADALQNVGWSNAVVMVFFVFFMVFAVMNIITGIFVESATESVYSDHDEGLQEEMRTESSAFKELRVIFERIDEKQSGSMSLVDFESALENPETLGLLRRLGIDVSAAQGLFRLLDLDSSGSVSALEFLVGCMKMRGGARSVDLATLMYENKRMMSIWNHFFEYVREEFKKSRRFERNLLQSAAGRAEVLSTYETGCESSDASKAKL
mmetsp:Transcript_49449/g.138477  ORF Transcript_49449/g.138477 Transcript_49449/m.138477 type:complete len:565 (+) Transcript_49449:151-1845(+)